MSALNSQILFMFRGIVAKAEHQMEIIQIHFSVLARGTKITSSCDQTKLEGDKGLQ
jgi:hypothetical protein